MAITTETLELLNAEQTEHAQRLLEREEALKALRDQWRALDRIHMEDCEAFLEATDRSQRQFVAVFGRKAYAIRLDGSLEGDNFRIRALGLPQTNILSAKEAAEIALA